jgi:hypothetical protein
LLKRVKIKTGQDIERKLGRDTYKLKRENVEKLIRIWKKSKLARDTYFLDKAEIESS